MELPDDFAAVSRMQAYIVAHLDEEITLDALAQSAGYSKFHAERIFTALVNKTPFEYIRSMRLTNAARTLQVSDEKIIDVALDNGFGSHDGFTRAFKRQFAITPQKYQRETPAVPWYAAHPIEAYYLLKEGSKAMDKEKVSKVVTVTAVEHPARKLILKRTAHSDDYFAMCEEIGCDWEGVLSSIPEKLDEWCYCQLPPNLMSHGTTAAASGVEVPLDYAKPIPDGCDVIELPPCSMLYFRTAPYDDPNDFGIMHEVLSAAFEDYKPELYGWQYAPELAPIITFHADHKTGVRMAAPVRKA
ncbi:hypothetical protein FACS18949_15520 [Clostridia bacterium]|nr:hypothetical protein FACS18949_15520 [Clostridia bacterium]